MAGEIDRLMADAFHQAAVASDDIGAMVDELVAETRRLQPLRHGEADGGGEALAERAGRRLDADRMAVFGMARRLEPNWRKLFRSSIETPG